MLESVLWYDRTIVESLPSPNESKSVVLDSSKREVRTNSVLLVLYFCPRGPIKGGCDPRVIVATIYSPEDATRLLPVTLQAHLSSLRLQRIVRYGSWYIPKSRFHGLTSLLSSFRISPQRIFCAAVAVLTASNARIFELALLL